MPKIVKPLSLGQIKSARPKAKLYKLSDGGGLSLWVLPTGGKSWRMTYTRPSDKRQDTLTLGLYPEFGLADAREWRDEIRAKLARGENPKAPANDLDAHFRFETRLVEWHTRWAVDGGKDGKGKEPRYAKQVLAAMEYNVLPAFSGRDVRTITTAEVVAVLRKMEERGVLEYLKRTKSSIGLFFDYMVADGTIPANPVRIIGQQVFRKPLESHFTALRPEELPLLIERLETAPGVSLRARLLIYWQLLSMKRPAEAAEVPLSEIDLDTGLWTIPAARMKRNLPHVVPISTAMRQIHTEAMEINVKGKFLFEGLGFHKPMHTETARLNLRNKMKLDTTGHGLRALARTYLRQVHKTPRDVADMLLAHMIKDKTERAYDRYELIDERRSALEI